MKSAVTCAELKRATMAQHLEFKRRARRQIWGYLAFVAPLMLLSAIAAYTGETVIQLRTPAQMACAMGLLLWLLADMVFLYINYKCPACSSSFDWYYHGSIPFPPVCRYCRTDFRDSDG